MVSVLEQPARYYRRNRCPFLLLFAFVNQLSTFDFTTGKPMALSAVDHNNNSHNNKTTDVSSKNVDVISTTGTTTTTTTTTTTGAVAPTTFYFTREYRQARSLCVFGAWNDRRRSCDCELGYEGPDCNTTAFCLHGFRFEQTFGSTIQAFSCHCHDNFEGERCEQPDCHRHGRPSNNDPSICECDDNFLPPYCVECTFGHFGAGCQPIWYLSACQFALVLIVSSLALICVLVKKRRAERKRQEDIVKKQQQQEQQQQQQRSSSNHVIMEEPEEEEDELQMFTDHPPLEYQVSNRSSLCPSSTGTFSQSAAGNQPSSQSQPGRAVVSTNHRQPIFQFDTCTDSDPGLYFTTNRANDEIKNNRLRQKLNRISRRSECLHLNTRNSETDGRGLEMGNRLNSTTEMSDSHGID